jgi:hypothetical protein
MCRFHAQRMVERSFAAIADDIADIRSTMATKTDLATRATKSDVRDIVRDQLKPIRSNLKVDPRRAQDLTEKLENMSGFRKEIDRELGRIAAIEKHLGINKKIAARSTPSLDLEVSGGLLAAIGDDLVFDNLPLIQTAESSLLDRRDMDKHIFSAPTLRLNKPKTLLRIKPLHGACRHKTLQDVDRLSPAQPARFVRLLQ